MESRKVFFVAHLFLAWEEFREGAYSEYKTISLGKKVYQLRMAGVSLNKFKSWAIKTQLEVGSKKWFETILETC